MKTNKKIGAVVLVVVICVALTAVCLADTEICDWCGDTIFKEIYTDWFDSLLCEDCAREYWAGWPGEFEDLKIGEVDNSARNTLIVLEILVGGILVLVFGLQGRKERQGIGEAVKKNLAAGINAVKESAGTYLKNVQAAEEKWTCGNCGAEHEEKMLFCPYCGTAKPKKPVAWTCAKCRVLLEAEYGFCPYCGGEKQEKTERVAVLQELIDSSDGE